jgi:hypothetical protein
MEDGMDYRPNEGKHFTIERMTVSLDRQRPRELGRDQRRRPTDP